MLELATVLRKTTGDTRLRTGRIVSWDSGSHSAEVEVNGTTVTVPALRSVSSPSVDDLAVLTPGRGGMVLIGLYGASGSTPPENNYNGTLASESRQRLATLSPYVTGSARNGAWRPDTRDVIQGDASASGVNYGAAFYRPRAIAYEEVTRVRVALCRRSGGSASPAAPTLRLLTSTGPTGSPASSASVTGPALKPGEEANFSLPVSWGADILAGTASGIGVYEATASPYLRFPSRASWGPSFALTITYLLPT